MVKTLKRFAKRIEWRNLGIVAMTPFGVMMIASLLEDRRINLEDVLVSLLILFIFIIIPIGQLFIKFWTYMDVYGEEPEEL